VRAGEPLDARDISVGANSSPTVGGLAPLFRLPAIGGGEVSLLEYRGRNLLVIFWDPHCEPCHRLAPALAELSGALPIVLISRGDIDAHETTANGSFPIGLQRGWDISRLYSVTVAPAAVAIDEWGRIAAEVAVGEDAVLALATTLAREAPQPQ
jgi:thiol-disulfide isomerase/thioredoxin